VVRGYRRRTKREVRDRRLLAKLAAFVKARRWSPSAPELAEFVRRERTGVWRALRRLRHERFVILERRGWALTRAGWDSLGVEPIRPLIAYRPRTREQRIAAVRRAKLVRLVSAHYAFALPVFRGITEPEQLPIYE
jgi:hypothetical protein